MEKQKVIAYYRVSTKGQGESGLGLESQKVAVHHYYGNSDQYEIIGEYTDVCSGKSIDRPELNKAFRDALLEDALFVVAKIDRLSRTTEHALKMYEQLEGNLASCDIPNLDKFTLTLFMAIADRERELISIRTKAALEQKRKLYGEWRKGSAAMEDGTAQAAAAEVNKAKAAKNKNNRNALGVVEAMYRNGEGDSLHKIAKKLTERGYKTSRGGEKWSAVQVKRLIERYL